MHTLSLPCEGTTQKLQYVPVGELTDAVVAAAAGPKLRRWYGEGEEFSEEDFLEEPEDPEDLPEPVEPSQRQTVLVTDADSAMGEQIVLQLILARYSLPRSLSLTFLKSSSSADSCLQGLSTSARHTC